MFPRLSSFITAISIAVVVITTVLSFSSPLVVSASAVDPASCIAACNSKHAGDLNQMCFDNGITYSVSVAALSSSCTIKECAATPVHAGTCECPNGCGANFFADTPLGYCDATTLKRCVCRDGWGGRDCSSVVCPMNSCSGHGECKIAPSPDASSPHVPGENTQDDGAHYCLCHHGWTGPWCDVPTIQGLDNAPFGTVAPDPRGPQHGWRKSPYYSGEKSSGDDHVIFNLSNIATINISAPHADHMKILNACNLYTNPYIEGSNMTFTGASGAFRRFVPVSWRVKGWASRAQSAKGYNIKTTSKKDKIKGIRKFGIKTGQAGGDSILHAFAFGSLARSLSAPVSRTALAVVYVNSVMVGTFYIEEKASEPEFLDSRFDTHHGNMIRLGAGVNMKFEGSWDPAYYLNQIIGIGNKVCDGDTRNLGNLVRYKPVEGNATEVMDDYIATVFNFSRDGAPPGTQTLVPEDYIDVDSWIRLAADDALGCGWDSSLGGNNYYMFRNPKNKNRWSIIEHDFDWDYGVCPAAYSTNIFVFAYQVQTTPQAHRFNPLRQFIFNTSRAQYSFPLALYTALMIEASGDASTTAAVPPLTSGGSYTSYTKNPFWSWYAKLAASLKPYVSRTMLFRYAMGLTPEGFQSAADASVARYQQRWADVCKNQIPAFCQEARRQLCSLKCINTVVYQTDVFGRVDDGDTNSQERHERDEDRTESNPPNLVAFCGSDGYSYYLPRAVITSSCMESSCGVAVKHLGPCGCPSDCFSNSGHGKCNLGLKKCECDAAWTGRDCSLPNCDGAKKNNCSGHGTCVLLAVGKSSSSSSSSSSSFCNCSVGYAGAYCDMKIPSFSSLSSSPSRLSSASSSMPEEQEEEPSLVRSASTASSSLSASASWRSALFDPFKIAVIHINTPSSLGSLTEAKKLLWRNVSINDATMSLRCNSGGGGGGGTQQQQIDIANTSVSVRLTGTASDRLNTLRKSYAVTMKRRAFFSSAAGGDDVDVTLVLESGGSRNPPLLEGFIFSELASSSLSSSSATTTRGTFSLLWIDDEFSGLYWLREDVSSPAFVAATVSASSAKTTKNTKAAALDYNVFLRYRGASVPSSSYANDLEKSSKFWNGGSSPRYVFEASNETRKEEKFVPLPSSVAANDFVGNLLKLINESAVACGIASNGSSFSHGKFVGTRRHSQQDNSATTMSSSSSSSCATAQQNLLATLDVSQIFNMVAVEALLRDAHHFVSGNSFVLAKAVENVLASSNGQNDNNNKWRLFDHNFGSVFSSSSPQQQQNSASSPSSDPFTFATQLCDDDDGGGGGQRQCSPAEYFNPLLSTLLSNSAHRRTFALTFAKLAVSVMNNNNFATRLRSVASFLKDWYARDAAAQLSSGVSGADEFLAAVMNFSNVLSSNAQRSCSSSSSGNNNNNAEVAAACDEVGPPDNGGLHGGAIAGIVIGAVCFVSVVGFVVWRRWDANDKKKKKGPTEHASLLSDNNEQMTYGAGAADV